jgi:hypothetical protein
LMDNSILGGTKTIKKIVNNIFQIHIGIHSASF